MSLKQVRNVILHAGWKRPNRPYCRPEDDPRVIAAREEGTDVQIPNCGIGFRGAFLRLVPEARETPTDRPVMNVCYDGPEGQSLLITFTFTNDAHQPVKRVIDDM